MKKFRKEGNIMLFALFFFLFVFLLTALFISLILMNETYQRVQNAAQVGARTRALAVSIPLKEQYGIIETFRPDVTQGYQVNYTEPTYSFSPSPGYDNAIYSPASAQYLQALSDADDSAKQSVISTINNSLGTNEAGDKIADIQPENICIQVLPLPAGDAVTHKATLNFTCTATVNGKSITITANNVEVYGYTHPLNNSGNVRVYNVVFVGVAYSDKSFFYNLVQTMVNGSDKSNWTNPPVRATYAIAYPQIDSCTTSDC